MSKYIKCTDDEFCGALEERLQPRQFKGLVEFQYINMETGENSRNVCCYRTTPKAKALALNFCPWCGFHYKWSRETEEQS